MKLSARQVIIVYAPSFMSQSRREYVIGSPAPDDVRLCFTHHHKQDKESPQLDFLVKVSYTL